MQAKCGPWNIVRQTFAEGLEDNVPMLGAALAFYSLFSLAPALVIALALAGAVFGREAAEGRLTEELAAIVGRQVARGIQQLTDNAHTSSGGSYAVAMSAVLLFIGATGAVVALKNALNVVWGVGGTNHNVWWGLVRDRFLSFVLIVGGGLLLVSSVVLTSFLHGMSDRAFAALQVTFSSALLINLFVSMVVLTMFFAMVFRILPDVRLDWRDLWLGSVVTSVLFLIGRELIALYFGHISFVSTYGAAGSLVAVLMWIYYSAQILLFGAEFTQVLARRCGARVTPVHGAAPVGAVQRG